LPQLKSACDEIFKAPAQRTQQMEDKLLSWLEKILDYGLERTKNSNIHFVEKWMKKISSWSFLEKLPECLPK
jgi:hypothetical protein